MTADSVAAQLRDAAWCVAVRAVQAFGLSMVPMWDWDR